MRRPARWLPPAAFALVALVATCADPEAEDRDQVVSAAPPTFPEPVGAPDPPPDPPPVGDPSIAVDVARQELTLSIGETAVRTYPVSTSKVGTGNRENSNRTPLGRHRVAEKFGDGAAAGTVFRSRIATGEIAEILATPTDVEEDLVLTRILWLEGLEPGRNRGPGIDSHDRYIYIHGTNEEGLIGTPASHGCVRMKNEDVIELYDRVPIGTPVRIVDPGGERGD